MNTAQTAPAASDVRGPVKNVFWSGHSLNAPPIPQYLAAISANFGVQMDWNLHTMAGASLEARTRGRPPDLSSWQGYRQGDNRDGNSMDVIAELRSPQTLSQGQYNVLVITEVHDFLWWLVKNDAIRLLRHYHDRFIDGNAAGQTFFYQAWLDFEHKDNPQPWIDYERAASPVWQCMATRVNTSLAAEGRADRLQFLPASLALVELVERATSPSGVPGITAATVSATMERIFRDHVHLTDLGAYYIALVCYSFIFAQSPAGAWVPPDVSREQADSLQKLAWSFYSEFQSGNEALTLAECSALMRDSFAEKYWRYVQYRERNTDSSWFKARYRDATAEKRRLTNTDLFQKAFAEDAAENPFRYDPETDRTYWHPPP